MGSPQRDFYNPFNINHQANLFLQDNEPQYNFYQPPINREEHVHQPIKIDHNEPQNDLNFDNGNHYLKENVPYNITFNLYNPPLMFNKDQELEIHDDVNKIDIGELNHSAGLIYENKKKINFEEDTKNMQYRENIYQPPYIIPEYVIRKEHMKVNHKNFDSPQLLRELFKRRKEKDEGVFMGHKRYRDEKEKQEELPPCRKLHKGKSPIRPKLDEPENDQLLMMPQKKLNGEFLLNRPLKGQIKQDNIKP